MDAAVAQPVDEALARAERRALRCLDELDPDQPRRKRGEIFARAILIVFEVYYSRSREIPFAQKRLFEERNWPETFKLSRERLTIYGRYLNALVPLLRERWPQNIPDDRGFWVEVEAAFLDFIHGRYEADLAFAFLRSTRRVVRQGEWAPVAYYAGRAADGPDYEIGHDVTRTFPVSRKVSAGAVANALKAPNFNAPFRDLDGDAQLLAERINGELERRGGVVDSPVAFEVINAGFFRNRGCYIAGRVWYRVPQNGAETMAGDATVAPGREGKREFLPIVIALLNEKDGIFADALITESDEIHRVFSSALANFHVTENAYHQLARFLHELMPKRPLGLHYSTIGFNHVGKVAVMKELVSEHNRNGELLDFAVGSRGTVAIGFSMPSSRYVMKVIRDTPAEGYKWDTFDGPEAILKKYGVVHDMDRAGSMLDNVIYSNARLERSWFTPELLQEFANAADGSVKILHRYVLFKHLIVQMKLVPLPVYLETASEAAGKRAIEELGICIQNNAAANIFNKDLDARNYGVSRIGKIYLFDYDAVEPLSGVKVRTNLGRFDGEEDIPDWYFETGTIFLPEEMLVGLRIDDPELRRYFREANAELMSTGYWEGMQRAHAKGLMPKVRSYLPDRKLRRPENPVS
ncbi:MAG: bifunctional isocitrate dehydrogenase kinase/phosphatase [Alphaproteobacteria bacterium]|nr:bifunctional isocitrate dehydrogenase kinase/phosphatase [Alphaproteobacteria bacterium]